MKFGLKYDAYLSVDPVALYSSRAARRRKIDSLSFEGEINSAITVDADDIERAMSIARDELERSDLEIPGFPGDVRITQVRFTHAFQLFAGEWQEVWSIMN